MQDKSIINEYKFTDIEKSQMIKFYLKSQINFNDNKICINSANKQFNYLDNKKLLISFEPDIKDEKVSQSFLKRIQKWNDEYELYKNININVLYLRDLNNSWFTRGLKDINTNSIEKLLQFLIYVVKTYNFSDIYMIGFSSGAYASILYGKLLALNLKYINVKSLAIGPKSLLTRYINNNPLTKNKLTSWLLKRLRSNVWPYITKDNEIYLDLLNILDKNTDNWKCEAICSNQNRVDLFHLNRINQYVNTLYYEAGNIHLLLSWLQKNNKLNNILDNFLHQDR